MLKDKRIIFDLHNFKFWWGRLHGRLITAAHPAAAAASAAIAAAAATVSAAAVSAAAATAAAASAVKKRWTRTEYPPHDNRQL